MNNKIKQYDFYIKISKNIKIIKKYQMPISQGYKNTKCKNKRIQTEKVKKENNLRAMRRSMEKVKELIYCNYDIDSKFVTLTFKDDIYDLDLAFKIWKSFRNKLERMIKTKLKYCGVVGPQDGKREYCDNLGINQNGVGRNVIHFHIAIFNLPFLDYNELKCLWNDQCQGGVYIQSIYDIEGIANYMTKHINLNFMHNKSRKRYFLSKNLETYEELKLNSKNDEDKYKIERESNEVRKLKLIDSYTHIKKEILPDKDNILREVLLQKVTSRTYSLNK